MPQPSGVADIGFAARNVLGQLPFGQSIAPAVYSAHRRAVARNRFLDIALLRNTGQFLLQAFDL
ncbi:hypothetical protein PhaeoP72_02577 [Phaeobacter inhibens]|nr:hypothetical protein PhaeoP72_02577 [Phaeobacter inhibens]